MIGDNINCLVQTRLKKIFFFATMYIPITSYDTSSFSSLKLETSKSSLLCK